MDAVTARKIASSINSSDAMLALDQANMSNNNTKGNESGLLTLLNKQERQGHGRARAEGWHQIFDHIYINSLTKRADRRAHVRQLMARLSVQKDKYSFVDAVDFKALDPVVTTVMNISYNRGPPRAQCCREVMIEAKFNASCTSTPGWDTACGEYGCSLSHMKALYLFLQSKAEHVLVLEDDAIEKKVLRNAVRSRNGGGQRLPQPPKGWSILKLEGCHDRNDNAKDIKGSKLWLPSAKFPDYGSGAVAYSRSAANWILENLLPKLFAHNRGHHEPWSYDDILRREIMSPSKSWPKKDFMMRPAQLWFAQDCSGIGGSSDIDVRSDY